MSGSESEHLPLIPQTAALRQKGTLDVGEIFAFSATT